MKSWHAGLLAGVCAISVSTIGLFSIGTNRLYKTHDITEESQMIKLNHDALIEMFIKSIDDSGDSGNSSDTDNGETAPNEKVSILGDSWSDYNSSKAYYKSVMDDGSVFQKNDMWWYGLDTEKVNAIGGSGVKCEPAALDSRDTDLGDNPGMIVVMIGGNDFITGVWKKDDYKKMVTNIQKKYPDAVVFLCSYGEIYNKKVKDGYILDLNNQIKSVANDLHAVYIDNYGMDLPFFSDNLHPNIEGQKKLGEHIKSVLKKHAPGSGSSNGKNGNSKSGAGTEVPPTRDNNNGQVTPPSSGSKDVNNPNLVEYDFAGTKVWVEAQRGAPWNTYVATGGSSVTKAGCMLYASAIAGSWATKSKRTVYDVVTGMGYGVNASGGKYYNTDPKLPYVGNNPPVTYQKSMAAAGATASGDLGSDINAGLKKVQQNQCKGIVVHCDSDVHRLVSSGGQHWFCILKYDASKGYLVASSNTSKQGWMSTDKFTNGVHYNHVIPFN